MHARASLLGVSAVLLCAVAARADEPEDNASRAAAAQALFEDAVKLMEQGKFAEACPKLAASEKLDPGAGTLLNLGTCYEKNGQTASAWATFIEAEAFATRTGRADWSQRAKEHSEKLAPHLPKLAIAVSKEATVGGLSVLRDGVALDEGGWGAPIPVDPGVHEVSAVAPRKKPWSTRVELRADQAALTVTVPPLEDVPAPLPPPPPAPPVPEPTVSAPPPPPPGFWTTERAIGAGVGGVGLAGLGLGVAFVALAVSKYNDASPHCPANACTGANYVDEGVTAHHLADTATATFVVGGLFVGAGATLLVVGAPGKPVSSPTSGWQLVPSVSSRSAGAVLAGAW